MYTSILYLAKVVQQLLCLYSLKYTIVYTEVQSPTCTRIIPREVLAPSHLRYRCEPISTDCLRRYRKFEAFSTFLEGRLRLLEKRGHGCESCLSPHATRMERRPIDTLVTAP